MRKVYNNKRSIGGSLFLLSAFCFLLFVSCSQEEFLPQETDSDAVKISASIGALQTRVSYDERNTTFDENDQIKVVNKLRTSKNVATYTLTDEEWNTADPFVWNGASKNEFEAWYPVTDGTSFDTFTLPTEQNSSALLGAADWMIASSGEIDKPEDQTLELYFLHRLSKVTVTIAEWNDEFGGTAQEVSTPKIYSKGTALTATYDDSGVTITATDGETGITPLVSGTSYTAIVAPAKYATTDKFMTFTVNGQEMTVLATPSSLNEEGLQAGLHYLFDLKVGKDAVTLYSVKVTPWEEKEIDGGVAEEVPPYTYDESTNTYTVLTADALNTAISNAKTSGTAENPAIIKLAANVEIASTLDEWGTPRGIEVDEGVITLDLNGHIIKLTGDDNDVAIIVDNGATLTINDSSEGKQGKITNAETVLYPYNGKLVINGGTFEGEFAVWGFENESVIEINGGTFIATYDAIYAQRSILTIIGGTFNGDRYALYLISGGTASITGGSFSGKEYDISTGSVTGFLSYNRETDTGPTFPDGLSIVPSASTGRNLNALLADGAAYYDADGSKIELDASAASYDGDITVKKLAATE